jgi:putative membrane-bound dehydrogenase-like protein
MFARRVLLAALSFLPAFAPTTLAADANRLTYLDAADPFYVGAHFPKLTTPQWVGDPNVEVVVTLGIDDLSQTARYEEFLRPILNTLHPVEGRAPVSIFCNALTPDDPQLSSWLAEGLSFEVHTLSHACPLLSKHDFAAAEKSFHGGVDLLNHVPGNLPVAFRTPCCDSINSPSPRVYAELFGGTNAAGQFLRVDSSVVILLTTNDPTLPRELVVDPDGRGRFTKYVPFPSFVTTVENYPYPWVIGRRGWEFPCLAPSDWEAQNILGKTNATMLADWQAALDAIALKQGTFNFVFHPHGWSANTQLVDFINYAAAKYGKRVKFLNYRDASDRLTENLGAGQALRADDGGDNGVRLLDLNSDGFLDVVIGNEALRRTRVWQPKERRWLDSDFPVAFVTRTNGIATDTGVRFGVVHADGRPTLLWRNETGSGAWTFEGSRWVARPNLLRGLEIAGQPVFTARQGRDQGVRFRDVDGDGLGELLVSNESQNAAFQWNNAEQRWQPSPFRLPPDMSLVNAAGEDNGLRFVDLNGDRHDDVIFSNAERFAVWTYIHEPFLSWTRGWTRKVVAAERREPLRVGEPVPATPADEIPPIVRAGPHRNNGAWFHSQQLWVQNEDTTDLPNWVDRRSFDDLLRGITAPAKSPADELATFHVPAGFKVELVAAEPLVRDPVAFDWNPDGRLWVAEMRDYPQGLDGKGQPGGVIKLLSDHDQDGRYDHAEEFLRDVSFPSGVMAWRKGVLVSAAPDLFYAEDTDGDGKADRREVILTGFREGNQQHRVNGFAWGLDGWVYVANGDSGGEIGRPGSDVRRPLQGRDLRFRPETGEFETIEGQTQFGRVRDDWGHWLGNANYAWLWHYELPARYLARNPDLAVRDTRRMLAQYEGGNRVFPRSRAQVRPNAVGAENTVTSGSSPAPYRDDWFGPDFATSVFISEPTENVIHREVLVATDAGLSSRRAPGEEASEFLASTDNWFKPTQLKTGPEGALYFADMYRLHLEHPEWIPADLLARIDVRAGTELGRIWRVVPDWATPPRAPFKGAGSTAELVAELDSPNGWRRDTAMRLLVERRDPAALEPLRQLRNQATHPKVRLQALATLAVLGGAEPASVRAALSDPSPEVRAHALQASEPLLRAAPPDEALVQAVLACSDDSSAAVKLQLAFTLGELNDPRVGDALVKIATEPAATESHLTAVLSSSGPHLATMLTACAALEAPPAKLVEHLLGFAATRNHEAALQAGVAGVAKLNSATASALQFNAIAGLVEAWERQGKLTNNARLSGFSNVFELARAAVADESSPEPVRLAGLRLLGRPGTGRAPIQLFVRLLEPNRSAPLQQAALQALQRTTGAESGEGVLRLWSRMSPSLQAAAVEMLLARPVWVAQLLSALEAGTVTPRELGPSAQHRLRQHPTPAVRTRASKLFAAVNADRQAVLEPFAAARRMAGEVDRGHEVFFNQCAACHTLAGEGNEVGPDLGALTDRSFDALLIAVMDPNRAVEERYLAYTAVTRTGQEFTGIIASESPNSLTLRAANGLEETRLRSELASLASTQRSLMPEGFEHSLDAAAFADLFAFVTAQGTPPKTFAGNRPAAVRPDGTGTLKLTAQRAELYGDSLQFEVGHGNLGVWQSDNDRAVWTLDLAQAGSYDVWVDWAFPGPAGKHRLRIEVSGTVLEQPVAATGSWDTYRQARVGTLHLPKGKLRLAVRGTPPVHEPMVDLREVRLVPAGKPAPGQFPAADPTK